MGTQQLVFRKVLYTANAKGGQVRAWLSYKWVEGTFIHSDILIFNIQMFKVFEILLQA